MKPLEDKVLCEMGGVLEVISFCSSSTASAGGSLEMKCPGQDAVLEDGQFHFSPWQQLIHRALPWEYALTSLTAGDLILHIVLEISSRMHQNLFLGVAFSSCLAAHAALCSLNYMASSMSMQVNNRQSACGGKLITQRFISRLKACRCMLFA